jgi:hypothetical protein
MIYLFNQQDRPYSVIQIERKTLYGAANLHPDHDTIAAFRRTNRATFEAAFLQMLLLARESGLLRLGTVSTNGTSREEAKALLAAIDIGSLVACATVR